MTRWAGAARLMEAIPLAGRKTSKSVQLTPPLRLPQTLRASATSSPYAKPRNGRPANRSSSSPATDRSVPRNCPATAGPFVGLFWGSCGYPTPFTSPGGCKVLRSAIRLRFAIRHFSYDPGTFSFSKGASVCRGIPDLQNGFTCLSIGKTGIPPPRGKARVTSGTVSVVRWPQASPYPRYFASPANEIPGFSASATNCGAAVKTFKNRSFPNKASN